MAIDTTNLVKFKKGLLANYQGLATKDSNTLYITTDERAIYLGDKRLGDYIRVANVEALKNVEKKSLDALYYAEAENVLARYNGTTWVQINAAGLTRVIVSGTGNAVAKVEVDSDNANALKVTYADYATLEQHNTLKDDVDELTESFNALAGTGEGSVQDRIDAIQGNTDKTIADVAAEVADNDSDITALQNRVTATEGVANKATSDLATLTETVAANHTAALKAAKDVQGNTTKTVAGLAQEIADNDTDILGLQNRMSAVEGVASGAASAVEEEAEARIAAVAALQKELDDTQGEVSADYNSLAKLEAKIKANATAIGSNDQDIAALQQADTNILAAISENSEAIGLLNGAATTEGSVKHTIATEIAKYVNADGDEDHFDTLRDIGTWLSEHSTDAIDMDNRIGANEEAIETLQGDLSELSESVAGNKTEATNAVNGLRNELLAGTTDYKTLGALETAVKAAKTQANTAEGKADTNA
ncbi:MAG: hypothetical protein E7270_01025 [Lachnospiraceae bacterium]|nr:hypothetical protein [Lachnospiraceae bacterium]